MYIAFIIGGVILVVIFCWFLFRSSSDESVETTKTVLSSDIYTKILLAIIALATSIIALQGFVN